MISVHLRPRKTLLAGSLMMLALAFLATFSAHAQKEQKEPHYRGYKPLPPAAVITVKVERTDNGKPIENAAVLFKASKNGRNQGSLEIKSDPEGKAKLDIIEVGSHVMVQVIADGYSTAAVDFDVPTEEKNVTIKMEKPRAQVSGYENNDGKASTRPLGVQEPPAVKPRKPVTPVTPGASAPQ